MNLHEKQIEILKLLSEFQEEPLTLREIQSRISGLTSPSHVQHHINQLEKKGYLKRNPSNPRDYKVLMDAERPISYVNLYGMAKCGPKGTLLSGNPIDRIPVYSRLIKFETAEAFMVEALGDSMKPQIKENDIVIAQSGKEPMDGDLVVCTLNDQVMIKKYRKLSRDIVLESINRYYNPIIVSSEDRLIVEGLVKGYIRSAMDTLTE